MEAFEALDADADLGLSLERYRTSMERLVPWWMGGPRYWSVPPEVVTGFGAAVQNFGSRDAAFRSVVVALPRAMATARDVYVQHDLSLAMQRITEDMRGGSVPISSLEQALRALHDAAAARLPASVEAER